MHRLVRRTSYLFNVALIHAHPVLFYSDRNETEIQKYFSIKVPILIEHISENFYPNKKTGSYLK